jgi:hypothetical protein
MRLDAQHKCTTFVSLGFDLYAHSALNLSAVRLAQIFKPVLRSGLKLFVLQHP